MTECIFCRIIAGEIPATRVREDADVLVFRDINPAAPVHLLVVPKRHIDSLADATENDREVLGKVIWMGCEAARAEGVAESGYRLVLNTGPDGGQSVAHVHLHVLGGRGLSWPPG